MAEGAPVLSRGAPGQHPGRMDLRTPMPESDFHSVGGRAGLPRLLPVPGALRHPAGAALPHRETPSPTPGWRGGASLVVTSTQIPHIVRPGGRPGHGHRLGLHPGDQALHRRRLRQQAGGALRAPQRLAHHPGGGPLCPAGRLREETFQNTRSRHPSPLTWQAAVDRRLRAVGTPPATAVSNQGGFTAPSHGHSNRGHCRTRSFRSALSGSDRATTPRPTTVYTKPPAPGAMRGLRHPPVQLCRGVA